MKPQHWLNHLRSASKRRRKQVGRTGSWDDYRAGLLPALRFERLEDRALLAIDLGDAPDLGVGNGPGDYSTLLADNGPRHTIVAGLFMGAGVDGELDAFPNAAANGDDVNQALPDDEDGLNNPLADLTLTIGGAPSVNVIVTNATGTAATLSGWIDYNANGLFDNASERAQVAVPDGLTDGVVTLVFPTVPTGFTGTTYARFRLSTDAAAANATGLASDGEVEDYVATIVRPADGTVQSTNRIDAASGGPILAAGDYFGTSITAIGDLNGDGVTDMAVGAQRDSTAGTLRGAIHVLFMNAAGAVISSQKITDGLNNGPALADNDRFGISVANLGDLDGDGIVDLAVGASYDSSVGPNRGAVYILFMNADGSVKNSSKIASGVNGGPALVDGDFFGFGISALGDLNADGVVDLAVGAGGDDTGGANRGAVYVLFLQSDGTAAGTAKIAQGVGGGPTLSNYGFFGISAAGIGDLNGDGVPDLAVGASADDTGGFNRGAVHVLFMQPDGSASALAKINHGSGGLTLANSDYFGVSVAGLGDIDGDGVRDLAVGSTFDDAGGTNRGAINVLFMQPDGSVSGHVEIGSGLGGGPALVNGDYFGRAIASLGDLDGDGVADFAVGAFGDSTGGNNSGAVHLLFQNPKQVDLEVTSVTESVATVVAGFGTGNLVYTVTVTNNGPFDASGVTFDQLTTLEPGVTVDTVVASAGGSFNGTDGSGVWNVGDLAVGATATLTLTLTVDGSAAIGTDIIGTSTTLATVNELDTDATNDTDFEDTSIVRGVDLEVTNSGPATVLAGSGTGNLVYVVTVFNAGPSDATGVTLDQATTLVSGATVDSVAGSAGTSFSGANGTGVWTVGDLPAGETATLTITISVGGAALPGTDVISNTATIATVIETDTDPTNDTAQASTSVTREVDVEVTQSAPVSVVAGSGAGNVVYVVTAQNNGPSLASGVTVTNVTTLPAGVTLDSVVASGSGTFDSVSGTWNVGTLIPGGDATLTITLTAGAAAAVGPNTIGNTATLDTVVEGDTDGSNNVSTATTSVARRVNLVVTQTESADPIYRGQAPEELTYIVTVTNNGPSNASGVSLNENLTLPAGVTIASIATSGGTTFATTVAPDGTWTVGNLPVGASATLTFVFSIGTSTANGAIVRSTAAIASVNEVRILTADDTASVNSTVLVADFGDAPAPFPTLLADNGARHLARGATFGATRDAERDGLPSLAADGDDTDNLDDETAFVSQTVLKGGRIGTVTVNVQNVADTNFVSAWIDFNRDGDWADPGEQIAADVAVVANGDLPLTFAVPAFAIAGSSVARFRISTATGLSDSGLAPNGEVEDFLITVVDGGNVTAALVPDSSRHGKTRLVLTGDDQFNEFTLELGAGGFENTLRLTPQNGTRINGSLGSVGLNGFESIFVQMLGGDDVMVVNGGRITGFISLDGGPGNDRFEIATARSKLEIFDQGGFDTLDFSAAPKGVKVDLAKLSGKTQKLGGGSTLKLYGEMEVLFGTAFNDTLKGNSANNIIVGGSGKDKITGGKGGMDVLIGGLGRDTIEGGRKGNSLIISGSTAHDADDAALLAILAEWTRLGAGGLPLDIDTRIGHLKTPNSGGLNGDVVLTSPGTIADDFEFDKLRGFGNNWFSLAGNDKIKGKKPSDRVV